MPPSPTDNKSKKFSQNFDFDAFEDSLSEGEAGLDFALENFGNVLYSGGTFELLSELLSKERKPHLFEYLFSIIDDGMTFMLRENLLAGFDHEACAGSPLSAIALDRIAKFLYFLQESANDANSLSLTVTDISYIESAQAILSSLATTSPSRQFGDSVAQPVEGEDNRGSVKVTRKKRSQTQSKQDKKSSKATPKIDQKPFLVIKEDVPATEPEAQALVQKLRLRQKQLLGQCIDLLRNPLWSKIIRDQFKPSKTCAVAGSSAVSEEHKDERPSTETDVSIASTPAYPHVQPLKVSLYFDSAKGLGEWRIFMSTTAVADLRRYGKNPKILNIIIKKIRELSNGFFSDDNQKKLKGPSKGIPIFEAKLTGDLRLVYQVDCMSEYESKAELQVLRLYGLFTHAQMDKNRIWMSLSAQLATRGAEYRRRIISRKKRLGEKGNVYSPQSWPDTCDNDELVEDTGISSFVNTDDLQHIHQWLVLEKYSAFSQALLNCVLEDKDSSPVFAVSPYEREIIEHPSSCYVLGRSGTGKTTTMAFKIFGMERAAQTQPGSKPRQLFVTQSFVLAKRVKEYFAKLSEFLSPAAGTAHELAAIATQIDTDNGLVDPEDDEDVRDDLPKRFSELQDSHFPLFVTFDKLCKLIEADLGISFTRPTFTKEHRRAERRFSLSSITTNDELDDPEADYMIGAPHTQDSADLSNESARAAYVSFESFRQNYWPRFPQDLIKNLDPALVYSEFLGTDGVIKGSEESLKSEKPFLSRDTYLALSDRTRSRFASSRNKIYTLFERYLALKQDYGDYDAADRSHEIIQRLKEGYARSVDFLYVDEAQDNLIIDAFLLRSLCRNPSGLFWAGDTAQTIAIGSSFRFDDLKASLYKFERDLYPSILEKDIVDPAFFQLTKNYRSHNGIVNCAEIIIQLITHFWPHSIDALRKERGMVDGPKPIFFTGWNDETARYEQFLLGEKGNSVEFGANQCILVRDDQARNELREQVGNIGLLMTLYESKGLEFDDVLLYNFFEDSPCVLSQWRTVLNFLNTTDGNRIAAPRFDDIRHAGICTELKFFYVAVTRARKNLWIIDRSEKGEPMKTLLVERGRVTICTPENAPRLAETSSPDEWAKMGNSLFGNKNYSQAMHCFERAGLPFELTVAEAFLLRQKARNVPRGKGEKVWFAAFSVAADAFFTCAQRSLQKKYYHIAAECFREAQADGLAAESYEKAEEYTSAAKHYRKANLFDKAVEIIQTKEALIDPIVVETIKGASRLHYIHVEKPEKALQLFDSEKDGLKFMEDCGFDSARATILEKRGRIHEAAELHSFEGRSQQAIRLLLKDDQDPESIRRAADYLLNDLWKQYAFGVEVKQRDAGAMDSLSLARSLNKSLLPAEAVEEFAMFDAISGQALRPRLNVYNELLSKKKNLPAAILVLDHILRDTRQLETTQAAIQFSHACFFYSEMLRQFWNEAHMTGDLKKQKLFGFRKISEDEFHLTEGSLLSSFTTKSRPYHRVKTDLVLHQNELAPLIKSSIIRRLHEMIKAQTILSSAFRKMLFPEPCLTYYAYQGQCNRRDCHRLHFDLGKADLAWYNERVRAHLFQIRFLQAADFALADIDRAQLQEQDFRFETSSLIYSHFLLLSSDWLTSLFKVLNPPLLALGSMANISQDPEFREGMDVVMIWIENRSFRIRSIDFTERWFLSNIVEIATLALYQDRKKAWSFIERTQFFVEKPTFSQHGATLGSYKIPDLIRSIDTFDPGFIQSGCLFIQHVVQFKLRVDVGYLCRLIETLCAASGLLYRNMSHWSRDCILPKSWMAYLLPKLDLDQEYNLQSPIWLFVKRSAELMRHLLLGSDREIAHLLGTAAFNVRHLSIQRICRAICLVGCNTHYDLRNDILHIFAKLREARTSLDPFPLPLRTRIYLESRSWKGLHRAVERSVLPSGLDELVQLVRQGCDPSPMYSDVKFTRIVFKNKSELCSLFGLARDRAHFKMSATAANFVPKAIQQAVAPVVQEEDQSELAEVIDDPFIADDIVEAVEDVDIRDDEEGNMLERPVEIEDNKPTTVSKEEQAALIFQRVYRAMRDHRRVKAARTIQRNVRHWLTHRAELRDRGVKGKRAEFYRACRANDVLREWPSRHHRAVYLGLVPHLLVCLDVLQVRIALDKNKAKKQLDKKRDDPTVDYDEVCLQLSQATKSRKHVEGLKEKVSPTSEWHVERTLQDLRNLVLDISELLGRLKVDDVELDISLAMKAVQERKPARREAKTKPQLNTDDLDDMY